MLISFPPKSQTCAAITPPSGPINYAANAQRNAQMGLVRMYQAFKGGGTQDFKGNSAFGTRANQAAAGNFNFGASIAAKGWSLFTAQALAGAGALLSNLNTQGGYALAQSAYMQGQYGGPSSLNPGSGAPAWNMGPGFQGFLSSLLTAFRRRATKLRRTKMLQLLPVIRGTPSDVTNDTPVEMDISAPGNDLSDRTSDRGVSSR